MGPGILTCLSSPKERSDNYWVYCLLLHHVSLSNFPCMHAATAQINPRRTTSTWRRCCECTVRTLCQSQGLVGADQRLWPRLPAACWLVQACRSLIRPVVHRCAACAGLVRPRAARPRPPAWTSSSHVVNRDYSTRHQGCATGSTVQTDRQTDRPAGRCNQSLKR